MSKRSAAVWQGIPIVITERSGIRWGKRPTGFNRCVGGELRGGGGGVAKFKEAVAKCKGKGKFAALTGKKKSA